MSNYPSYASNILDIVAGQVENGRFNYISYIYALTVGFCLCVGFIAEEELAERTVPAHKEYDGKTTASVLRNVPNKLHYTERNCLFTI